MKDRRLLGAIIDSEINCYYYEYRTTIERRDLHEQR